MTILNNVNAGRLARIIKEAETDKSKVKRSQKIEGEWLLEEGGPQFRGEVNFENGKITMESDQPTNLGGSGTRPGPLHYCFFGLVSCYTATFATVASTLGVELKKLTAGLESNLDFSRTFGLSQAPVMEKIHITLEVESEAPREKPGEIERLAYERCPAVYALSTPVNLKTSLEVR